MQDEKILSVENLTVNFDTEQGKVYAVRDITFDVKKGEVLGIVGESGSGKSVSMYSVMGLLAQNGRMVNGKVIFDGKDIARNSYHSDKAYDKCMRDIRGNTMSMIFQDPMTFLNPVLTIEDQLIEPITNHNDISHAEAKRRALELMRKMGIPSPEKRIKQYPHELSGGMRQRIIIAIALANNPKLIIADEPTTALDVTIQAQILDLIKDMTKQLSSSTIMITHDLGVVASMCDRINIMYGGKIVESGTDEEIFYKPNHPYTRGLLNCVNNPENDDADLTPIPGSPPDLLKPPAGCPFVDRCEHAMKICRLKLPETTIISETHTSMCWLNELARRKQGRDAK